MIRISIDDAEFYVSDWKTYEIKGLKKGKHVVVLELLNSEYQSYVGVYTNDIKELYIQ